MTLVATRNESGLALYGNAEGQSGQAVAVDAQGRLLTAGGGSFGVASATYAIGTQTSATVETYDYYKGGDPAARTGGVLVSTLVITYADAAKDFIIGIGKTL